MMSIITCPTDGQSYNITHKIGSGGFAEVYLTKSSITGNVYALKSIKKSSIKSSRQFAKIKSEIRLHSLCGITDESINKFIVPFNKHWSDNKFIYILMKYCPNGSLQDWLSIRNKKYNQPISEYEIKFIMKQVTLGVQYLHDKFNIIHRDLKLANIMLDQYLNIQICDFGFAAQLEQNQFKRYTVCGTPNFIAPEMATAIKNKNNKIPKNNGHSYEVDIWAIGVMIYTLFYGNPPFKANSIAETVQRIINAEYSFPSTRQIPDKLKHLISEILTVDVTLRLPLSGILDHVFFTSGRMPEHLPLCALKRIPEVRELCPKEYGLRIALRHELNKQIVNVLLYIDRSDKYGVGYILSNGYTGCLFNDQTSLLLASDKRTFLYVIEDEINLYDYTLFAYIDNKEFHKKCRIFQAFAEALWNECIWRGDQWLNNVFVINNNNLENQNFVFVKKYRNMKHATIFRMNQSIIHSVFLNQMHICIHPDSNNEHTKMFVLNEGNYSLREYESVQLFKQTAPRIAVNCAKYIKKSLLK